MKTETLNYEAAISSYNNAYARFEFHADTATEAENHIRHIVNSNEVNGFSWDKIPTQIHYIRYKKKDNKKHLYFYTENPFDIEMSKKKLPTIGELFTENEKLKAINDSLLKEMESWKRENFDNVEMASETIKELQRKNDSLLNALKLAHKMLNELGNNYCRNKEGYLKDSAAINGWDAEIDINIQEAIQKAEQ